MAHLTQLSRVSIREDQLAAAQNVYNELDSIKQKHQSVTHFLESKSLPVSVETLKLNPVLALILYGYGQDELKEDAKSYLLTIARDSLSSGEIDQ